jgi:hypothetical protein
MEGRMLKPETDDVERVLEQVLVVRADVERDRERFARVHAADEAARCQAGAHA